MTDRRFTRPVKLRLAPADATKLEGLAADAGLTVSAWVSAQISAYDDPPVAGAKRALAAARKQAMGAITEGYVRRGTKPAGRER